jgi:hypothetical protein
MPKKTEYAQGTPCWIDLQTTDQSGGKKFYTSLLGWSYDDRSMPGTSAVYSMALLSGETVAAIAPMPPGAPEGMPPMWNTYLAVDDVDAAAEKVVPAGGQVLMPPMDIVDSGRMAFVADPTGATVGLWQANQHIGATLVNEPGTLIWNELITDKPDSALAFYEAVVGLTHFDYGDGAGRAVQGSQGRRNRCRRMHGAADAGRAQLLARLLRGGRHGRLCRQSDRGGRAGYRRAVRRPRGGPDCRVDRPAWCGLQRDDAGAATVGADPVPAVAPEHLDNSLSNLAALVRAQRRSKC